MSFIAPLPSVGLKLWFDDSGDGATDPAEIRTIDAATGTWIQNDLISFNGYLGLVYYTNGAGVSLKLWYDDGRGGGIAGDKRVNGTEVRAIQSNYAGARATVTSYNGRLAISFYRAYLLKLWVDDGLGGGVAGDLEVNGGEVRNLSPTSTMNPTITMI